MMKFDSLPPHFVAELSKVAVFHPYSNEKLPVWGVMERTPLHPSTSTSQIHAHSHPEDVRITRKPSHVLATDTSSQDNSGSV